MRWWPRVYGLKALKHHPPTGRILSWRARVGMSVSTLQGDDYTWDFIDWNTAACHCMREMPRELAGSLGPGGGIPWDAPRPDPPCEKMVPGCGFHACFELGAVVDFLGFTLNATQEAWSWLLALVEAEGRVVVHEKGLRAERMRIVAQLDPDSTVQVVDVAGALRINKTSEWYGGLDRENKIRLSDLGDWSAEPGIGVSLPASEALGIIEDERSRHLNPSST